MTSNLNQKTRKSPISHHLLLLATSIFAANRASETSIVLDVMDSPSLGNLASVVLSRLAFRSAASPVGAVRDEKAALKVLPSSGEKCDKCLCVKNQNLDLDNCSVEDILFYCLCGRFEDINQQNT